MELTPGMLNLERPRPDGIRFIRLSRSLQELLSARDTPRDAAGRLGVSTHLKRAATAPAWALGIGPVTCRPNRVSQHVASGSRTVLRNVTSHCMVPRRNSRRSDMSGKPMRLWFH